MYVTVIVSNVARLPEIYAILLICILRCNSI